MHWIISTFITVYFIIKYLIEKGKNVELQKEIEQLKAKTKDKEIPGSEWQE